MVKVQPRSDAAGFHTNAATFTLDINGGIHLGLYLAWFHVKPHHQHTHAQTHPRCTTLTQQPFGMTFHVEQKPRPSIISL